MKHLKTAPKKAGFHVVLDTPSSQAAYMTLAPGESSGPFENEHPHSQQWLYVIEGTGRARVNKRRIPLTRGSLLLIDRNENHQITNTGRGKLVTLNIYVPSAYKADGELKWTAQVAAIPREIAQMLTGNG